MALIRKVSSQHGIKGFNVRNLPPQALTAIFGDEAVVFVEEDGEVNAIQAAPASWGLDRIDEPDLPLDGLFNNCQGGGAGVNIYIIDTGTLLSYGYHTKAWLAYDLLTNFECSSFTGINENHLEFAGRLDGANSISVMGYTQPDHSDWNDDNGHGTHCAGTAAGASVGVAPQATLVAVKVMDNNGSGSTSSVLAGIDFVRENSATNGGRNVASMSLAGGKSFTMNAAVASLRAAGTPIAVAAGNSNSDAKLSSPASEVTAITVGATDRTDARAVYSNYGAVVDIFAPGSDIFSAWISESNSYNTISGTSMAAPHVAGALASIWGNNPSATADGVEATMLGLAVQGKLSGIPRNTINLLLQVCDGGTNPPPPPSDCNVVNCEACVADDPANCASCQTGYLLSSGVCLACPANCDECSDAATCIVCSPGYNLEGGVCVQPVCSPIADVCLNAAPCDSNCCQCQRIKCQQRGPPQSVCTALLQ